MEEKELKASDIRAYQMDQSALRQDILDVEKAKQSTNLETRIKIIKKQIEESIYSPAFAGWCDLSFKKQIDDNVDRNSVVCNYSISRNPITNKIFYWICDNDFYGESEFSFEKLTQEDFNDIVEGAISNLISYFNDKGFAVESFTKEQGERKGNIKFLQQFGFSPDYVDLYTVGSFTLGF